MGTQVLAFFFVRALSWGGQAAAGRVTRAPPHEQGVALLGPAVYTAVRGHVVRGRGRIGRG